MPVTRIGVVGLGYWGKHYVRLLSQRDDVILAAISDCDPTRLATWHNQLPGVCAYTDAEQLLRQKLDGVIVATPASTHYDIVRQALEQRIPVLVEKPLTLRSREAELLCNLAQKYDVPLLVGHTYLFAEPIRRVRELLREGVIGEVRYVQSTRANLGIIRSDCDVIWDLAPHDIAILLYLLEPSCYRVGSVTRVGTTGLGCDCAQLALELPKNIAANVTVSWLWPEKCRKLILLGTKGAICYEDKGFDSPLRLYLWPEVVRDGVVRVDYPLDKGPASVIAVPPKEPLAELIQHFIRCIHGTEQPISDGRLGLEVVRILEACEAYNKDDNLAVMEFGRNHHVRLHDASRNIVAIK
jgi:predicted dehydrogenase